MKAIALLFCLLATPSLADEAAVCNGYLRIQDRLHCPADGYLLNTGYRFCRDYVAADSQFSPAGRRAMALIRRCLTSSLEARGASLTCDTVEDVAFDTHVGCYVSSGFCELPLADKAIVFKVAARIFWSGKAWKQLPKIEAACESR